MSPYFRTCAVLLCADTSKDKNTTKTIHAQAVQVNKRGRGWAGRRAQAQAQAAGGRAGGLAHALVHTHSRITHNTSGNEAAYQKKDVVENEPAVIPCC